MGRMVEDEVWRAANKDGKLEQRLRERAQKIADRATQISRSKGGSGTYRVEVSTRPKGRVQALVVTNDVDEEYGTETVERIGALRKAARGE